MMKRFLKILLVFLTITSTFIMTACTATPSKIIAPIDLTPTVTLAPNDGSVRGTIYVEQNGKYLPLKNNDLFLGNILISPSGATGVAGLDPGTAPRTSTDEQGNFVFQNVPAGKYGIILYLVTHAYLLNETSKEASMIITVTAGKVTDLGKLQYTNFPITPAP